MHSACTGPIGRAALRRGNMTDEGLLFTDGEKAAILEAALSGVESVLHGARASLPVQERGLPPRLAAPRGVFVTILEAGRVRGCMGGCEPLFPLIDACRIYAEAAAHRDPRFTPLARGSHPVPSVEVAVLGGVRPLAVTDGSLLGDGKVGLVLSRGFRREVFLPRALIGAPRDVDGLLAFLGDMARIDADDPHGRVEWGVFDVVVVAGP